MKSVSIAGTPQRSGCLCWLLSQKLHGKRYTETCFTWKASIRLLDSISSNQVTESTQQCLIALSDVGLLAVASIYVIVYSYVQANLHEDCARDSLASFWCSDTCFQMKGSKTWLHRHIRSYQLGPSRKGMKTTELHRFWVVRP